MPARSSAVEGFSRNSTMRPLSSTLTAPKAAISSAEHGLTAIVMSASVLNVIVEELAVVHPVHVVPGQDQHVLARELGEDMEVLPDRVGGALEPGLDGWSLLCGEDLNIASRERVEAIGAADVTVERHRVELGEHVHPFHARVDRVRNRDVDQPVLARDRHRRLAALQRQRREARAASAAEDQDRDIQIALLESAHSLLLVLLAVSVAVPVGAAKPGSGPAAKRGRRKRQQSAVAENPRSLRSHLQGQETRHQRGVCSKRTHDPAPEPRVPLNQQQKPGDCVGVANDSPVGIGIVPEITGSHRLDESRGLAKGQGETLAGDRVEVARGIADQGEVAADHFAAPLLERPRSTVLRRGCCVFETSPKAGKALEKIIKGGGSPGPQKSDPYKTLPHRGHIGLPAVGPIDLDQIGPWFDLEVAAHAEPPATPGTTVKTRPSANS